MGTVTSLLDREVYSMSQADRLLGVTNGTASRWINGYTRKGVVYEPLVRETSTESQIVTWGEFVEARLISEYRRLGASVFLMRPAIMALRREFGTNHPLATTQPFVDVRGRELVQRIQQETELQRSLWFVVHTGQTVLPSIRVQRFQQEADYDQDGAVHKLTLSEHVVMDPDYASGEPTIAGRRLRVLDVADALAAGTPQEEIAEMWDLEHEAIEEALRWSNIA